MNISRQMPFRMVLLVWHYTTTCAGVGKTVAGEGRTGLDHSYQLNMSTVSAGVWTTTFLRFHNAVKSGRTCIYFGKIFKNDVLRLLKTKFFEKFRKQGPVKIAIAKIIEKFRDTGSILDKNLNRQKSVLTPGILQDIQMGITRYPHKYNML